MPLAWYFWNYAEDGHKDGVPYRVRASAICDDAEWVQCEDCNAGDYSKKYFVGYWLDGDNALINTCNFNDWIVPGLFSYLASILLILLVLAQNAKGGMGSQFGGGGVSQAIGVKKGSALLEKLTWGFAAFVMVASIAVNITEAVFNWT